MNVVDSSAWLEFFAAGQQAGRFARVIEDTRRLLVPSIVVTEVCRRVMLQRGEDTALLIAAQLRLGRIIDLDATIAVAAARLGVAHRLPLADSIIYATAQRFDATLWTMDVDFAGLPGVHYLPKAPG